MNDYDCILMKQTICLSNFPYPKIKNLFYLHDLGPDQINFSHYFISVENSDE